MSSGTAIVKAKSGLNVRKGAGTNYAKIGALPHGAKVNFSGEQNGWLKITHNSQQGFISKQYTSVTSSATSGGNTKQTQNNVSASSKTVEITASALRVRRGPSTNYDQIGLLAQGKVVQVTGESNGWYRISYGGQEGWISAQFTKAVSGGASTSTTPAQTGEKSVNQKYTVTLPTQYALQRHGRHSRRRKQRMAQDQVQCWIRLDLGRLRRKGRTKIDGRHKRQRWKVEVAVN